MCLQYKQEVNIPQIDVYKLFTRDLLSPFNTPDKETYKVNSVLTVNNPDRYFYSFEKFESAYSTLSRLFLFRIIILPVTLYDVKYTGTMYIDDDPQALPLICNSYMSKQIKVNYSEEIVAEIIDLIYQKMPKFLHKSYMPVVNSSYENLELWLD